MKIITRKITKDYIEVRLELDDSTHDLGFMAKDTAQELMIELINTADDLQEFIEGEI